MTRTKAETREHYGSMTPASLEVHPATGTEDERRARTAQQVAAARLAGSARLAAFQARLIGQPPPDRG